MKHTDKTYSNVITLFKKEPVSIPGVDILADKQTDMYNITISYGNKTDPDYTEHTYRTDGGKYYLRLK